MQLSTIDFVIDSDSVIDSEIVPGYSIFWWDRDDHAGRVLITAVKGGIQASRWPDLEKEGIKVLVVHLKIANTRIHCLNLFLNLTHLHETTQSLLVS